jgi:hypothetical protein
VFEWRTGEKAFSVKLQAPGAVDRVVLATDTETEETYIYLARGLVFKIL